MGTPRTLQRRPNLMDGRRVSALVVRKSPEPTRLPIEHSPLRQMFVKALLETGLSNRQIARRAGVHHSAVSHLINGSREGRIETWELLLQAAGVELGYRHTKDGNDE